MKRNLRSVHVWLALFFAFPFQSHTFAQSDPIRFGKMEVADFQTKTYAKDTSAEAVVLCDYGQTEFVYNNERGFQTKFERITRVRILKKSGYDWATVEVPLYQSNAKEGEKLTDLKGYTYNLQNGQVMKEKLGKEAVFLEKRDENHLIQKFTLPNVKEGSVIEYTYTVTSDFVYNLPDWAFQGTIPVVWSEYRVSIPEYFSYRMQMQGYESFHINSTDQKQVSFNLKVEGSGGAASLIGSTERVPTHFEVINATATAHRWVTKDVPAIRAEAYTTTPLDYLSKIEFELSSTNYPGQGFKPYASGWPSLNESLLRNEYFGTQLNRTGFAKEAAGKIKSQATDPAQRMMAAYEYVRRFMKWNGIRGIYSIDGVKKAHDNRTGTAADINLMLVGMLRELGLDASPVLLSTRDHGRILEHYTMLTKFNYVVAHVNMGGKDVLLDATDAVTGPGMLPARCLNGMGRLVSKDGGRWVPLSTTEKATGLTTVQMTLDENGDLSGTLQKSCAGYEAWTHRTKILAAGKDKHTENLKKDNPAWQISKVELQNLDDCTEALGTSYELSISEAAQKAGNMLYLKPILTEGVRENPFKLTERKYPVDFATGMDDTYIASFTIPAGYKVEEMPKNAVISLPEQSGRFSFMVAVNGNVIQVNSKISIRKPVFYAEEYAALREFYSLIVSKHAEQIVLKKI